jgi:hypothetical protein
MIAGVMAISNFPFWKQTVTDLMKYADKVYFRFDGEKGDPEIVNQLESVCGEKFGRCFIAGDWRVPEWREEMLQLVSVDKPDVVLCPDQDETFGEGFKDELDRFIASDKKGMMFKYAPLMTSDGRVANNGTIYPVNPHMKVFKWAEGLSYFPYHGNAKLAKYINPDCHWNAVTKINHWCCYTKMMERAKKFRDDTSKKKAIKAVTLIGFGPSSKNQMQAAGEIWSLNNCYDALKPEAYRICTRIFEMHKLEKRMKEKGRDGKPHLWHLDQAGKEGRRIILHEKSDQITNSESYPLLDVIAKTGVDWFAGSPCYMLALAVMEGYSHIRIFGLDQMDWEHMLQRECFAGWCMYAIGRGIQMSGNLTWLERYTKRYGYDYGPEFDDYQEELLWSGHPMKVHYKIPSRVVEGKLFDGKR